MGKVEKWKEPFGDSLNKGKTRGYGRLTGVILFLIPSLSHQRMENNSERNQKDTRCWCSVGNPYKPSLSFSFFFSLIIQPSGFLGFFHDQLWASTLGRPCQGKPSPVRCILRFVCRICMAPSASGQYQARATRPPRL